MPCNCKLSLVSNNTGHTLTAEISGDIRWKGTFEYPGLPVGDPNLPVNDQNPIAVFQDLIGKVSMAMQHQGITDSNADPNVVEFNGISQDDACVFEAILLQMCWKLAEVGQRIANRKSGKPYDHGRVMQSWRLAQSAGRKGNQGGHQHGKGHS